VRREVVRWGLCAAAVATAHGCAWFVLTTPNVIAAADAGSPIVTLELSPILAALALPPDEAQADAPSDAPAPLIPPVAHATPTPEPRPSVAPPFPEATPTPAPSPNPTPTPTLEPVAPRATPVREPPLPASSIFARCALSSAGANLALTLAQPDTRKGEANRSRNRAPVAEPAAQRAVGGSGGDRGRPRRVYPVPGS
jgi:hypothetical protein